MGHVEVLHPGQLAITSEVDAAVSRVRTLRLPGGRVALAAGGEDGVLRVWCPLTGQVLAGPVRAHPDVVLALESLTLPDGSVLLASAAGHEVTFWDAATLEPAGLPGAALGARVMALAAFQGPDGMPLLACGGEDGTLRLWNPLAGAEVGQPRGRDGAWVRAVAAVRLDAARTLLAASGADGAVRWWNPVTGTPAGRTGRAHVGYVLAATSLTLPEGQPGLATGGEDTAIRLWDATSGTPTGDVFSGHSSVIESLAEVPTPGDWRPRLISGGRDMTVRLWDPTSVTQVGASLRGHSAPVRWVGAMRVPGHGPVLAASVDKSGRILVTAVGPRGFALDQPVYVPGAMVAGGWAGAELTDDDPAEQQDDEALLASLGSPSGTAGAGVPGAGVAGAGVVGAGFEPTLVLDVDAAADPDVSTAPVARVPGRGATQSPAAPPAPATSAAPSAPPAPPALPAPPAPATPADDTDPAGRSPVTGQPAVPAQASASATSQATPQATPQATSQPTAPTTPAAPAPSPHLTARPGRDDDALVAVTRPLADDVPPSDVLSRGVLAAHLGAWLWQLSAHRQSRTSVVHLDGRPGSGRSTLVRLLLQRLHAEESRRGDTWDWLPGPALGEPVVVGYDAWRQSVVDPQWWSLAASINRQVRATRSRWTRVAMTFASAGTRLVRSVPVVAAGLAGAAAGLYVVARQAWDGIETFTSVLALVATVSALALTGVRVLFWQSPVLSRLSLRGDDAPLATVAFMITWLRRWSPREPGRQRDADRALGLLLLATSAWGAAQVLRDGRAITWPVPGDARAAAAAVTLVAAAWWVTRLTAGRSASAASDTDGAWPGWAGLDDAETTEDAAPTPWWRPSSLRRRVGNRVAVDEPAGWAALVGAGLLVLLTGGLLVGFRDLAAPLEQGWAWVLPAAIALVAALAHTAWSATLAAGERERRPVLLVIDNLDRCAAATVVELLESVHTLLREPPEASRRAHGLPGWRQPARLFVLVLADGRWVRAAFQQRYDGFEGLGTPARALGADCSQSVFDHTVLVPPLSPGQVRAYLDAVLAGPDGVLFTSTEQSSSEQPSGQSTQQPSGQQSSGQASGQPPFAAARAVPKVGAGAPGPRGRAHDGDAVGARVAALRVRLDTADPQRLRSEQLEADLRSVPAHAQEELRLLRVLREAGAEGVGAGERHVLAAYADLLPDNPRLIKRVANSLAMLLAVKDQLRHDQPLDVVVRAAILFVACPTLVDDLLDAVELPPVDGDSPFARADLRRLLTSAGTDVLDVDAAAAGGGAGRAGGGAGAGGAAGAGGQNSGGQNSGATRPDGAAEVAAAAAMLQRVALCFGKALPLPKPARTVQLPSAHAVEPASTETAAG